MRQGWFEQHHRIWTVKSIFGNWQGCKVSSNNNFLLYGICRLEIGLVTGLERSTPCLQHMHIYVSLVHTSQDTSKSNVSAAFVRNDWSRSFSASVNLINEHERSTWPLTPLQDCSNIKNVPVHIVPVCAGVDRWCIMCVCMHVWSAILFA